MKVNFVLFAAIAAALPWNAAPLHAAESFTEARVTRLENEVRILKEGAAPRTASVGDAVSAVSSVATGAGSRAELQFPDKSLTRLGANSRLTIRGDERTLDLDQGVVFLQVPKQMGGAKLRTGAVTAAVTGTTVIFETFPGAKAAGQGVNPGVNVGVNGDNEGGFKLIVVEGQVELFRNSNPSDFRTVNAGEMLMMKHKETTIPQTMSVDVKLMLKTGNKFFQQIEGTPNAPQVNATLQRQQHQIASGVLQNTNVIIPGRGHVARVVDHPSNVAHNAMLVHAINNNGGGNNNKFLNLLGPGNNGLGALNGNGKGKGNGFGQGNGNGFGQGNGNGKAKGNGNANAFGQGNGNGQGPGNKGKGNAGGNGNGNGNANGGGGGGGGGGGASANSNKGGGGPPSNPGGGPPGGPPGGGPPPKKKP